MLGLAFIEWFVQLSTLLILSRHDFYQLLASMRAAFPCPVISPWCILVHECPCCRNSTFNYTPETHLFDTLSLVNVSDDLLGNWAHDFVEFWLNARYLLGIDFFRLDRSCSAFWVSHPRVLIAQQLLIDCARYQRMIVRTLFYPMHCTLRRRHFARTIIGKIPKSCRQVLDFWYHQVMHNPSDLLRVCASDWIRDAPVLSIDFWNWLSTFLKWDLVEMEHPVRNVAAFKSPPMILCRPSDFFISAWMWVFTRLWRSGRFAVAWWILIMLIRSPSCVIVSSNKTHPWAMCSGAFLPLGLCQFTTSALGQTSNTLGAERWLLWYALFRYCIHHLALGHCLYLLLSQYCCLQQCNICTLDTSAWNLAELKIASSGNSDLLQHYNNCFLSHGLCDVRLLHMYTKWLCACVCVMQTRDICASRTRRWWSMYVCRCAAMCVIIRDMLGSWWPNQIHIN